MSAESVFEDPEQQAWYDERAAILEYDAGFSRRHAEVIAAASTRRRFRDQVQEQEQEMNRR